MERKLQNEKTELNGKIEKETKTAESHVGKNRKGEIPNQTIRKGTKANNVF